MVPQLTVGLAEPVRPGGRSGPGNQLRYPVPEGDTRREAEKAPRVRNEPMKPAPPVTSTRMPYSMTSMVRLPDIRAIPRPSESTAYASRRWAPGDSRKPPNR